MNSSFTYVKKGLAPESDQTNLGLTYGFKSQCGISILPKILPQWEVCLWVEGEGQLEKRQNYVELRILDP